MHISHLLWDGVVTHHCVTGKPKMIYSITRKKVKQNCRENAEQRYGHSSIYQRFKWILYQNFERPQDLYSSKTSYYTENVLLHHKDRMGDEGKAEVVYKIPCKTVTNFTSWNKRQRTQKGRGQHHRGIHKSREDQGHKHLQQISNRRSRVH